MGEDLYIETFFSLAGFDLPTCFEDRTADELTWVRLIQDEVWGPNLKRLIAAAAIAVNINFQLNLEFCYDLGEDPFDLIQDPELWSK
jgi:hypothetical protein